MTSASQSTLFHVAPALQEHAVVDSDTFKSAMAQWASGVTVVTSVTDAGVTDKGWVGITASSLTSVSLNPPRVLICVAKRLYTHQVILSSGVFAVSVLNANQVEIGMRFAGMIPELSDRFAGIDVRLAETGSPILPDVLAWLDCRVAHAYDGGDHTIFVGDVLAAGAGERADPVLYFKRQWRKLDAQPAM
jgi:flavin reductase (DIM6/NTAB) family NADH-FMN oxidoreductase RutF